MGYITWGIYIRDATTGQPITGALVELLDRYTKERKYSGYTNTFKLGLDVYHGHCTLYNVEVPPEFYILRVSKSGYATSERLQWVTPMGTLGGPAHSLNPEAPITLIETKTTITISPKSGIIPYPVNISGRLIRTDTGAGISGRAITIYRKRPNESAFLAFSIKSTDGAGNYSDRDTIGREGTYEYYAEFGFQDPFKNSKSPIISSLGEVEEIKSTLHLTVLETKTFKPIEGVRCNLNGLVKYTDASGKASWIEIESRDYRLTLTKTGYKERIVPTVYLEGIKEMKLTQYLVLIKEEEPEPEPSPEGATHALVCNYYNIFGFSAGDIEAKVKSLVVPVCNGMICALGYDYVGVDAETGYGSKFKKGNFKLFYRARGTPAIPVALILKALIVVIAGIVVFWVAWVYLRTEEIEYKTKKSLDDLLREGYIDKEQWEKLRELEAEEEDMLGKIMDWLPMLLLVLIIASVAGALRGAIRRD